MYKLLLLLVFISPNIYSQTLSWGKFIKGTTGESSRGIVADSSGNIYTIGACAVGTDFNPPSNDTSQITGTFLAKYDSSGNLLWSKYFNAQLYKIAINKKQKLILYGKFSGNIDFDFDPNSSYNQFSNGESLFFARYSQDAGLDWVKVLPVTIQSMPYSLGIDNLDNIVIGGSIYNSTIDFDPGPGTYNKSTLQFSDGYFLSKYDSSGNFIWAGMIEGNYPNVAFHAIAFDSQHNIFVSGTFSRSADFDFQAGVTTLDNTNSNNYGDVFVAKYSPLGVLMFAFQLGENNHSEENATIVIDHDDNFYITPQFSAAIDMDPGPNTHIITTYSGYDFCIARYSNLGILSYVKHIKSSGYNDVDFIGLSTHTIWVAGIYSGVLYPDPQSFSTSINSYNNLYDSFFACYTLDGQYIAAKGISSEGTEMVTGIWNDESGNFYLAGEFDNTINLESVMTVTSGENDIYISKWHLTNPFLSVSDYSIEQFKIFPNPVSNDLFLDFPLLVKGTIQIADVAGRIALNVELANRIDVSTLKPGIYFLKISESPSVVKKFIKY